MLLLVGIFFTFCVFAAAEDKILLELKGDYLAYSYDYDQIYGRTVEFHWADYTVKCRHLKIDIPSRSFYAFGEVTLKQEDEVLMGDELLFSPEDRQGSLILYKEQIEIKVLGSEEGQKTLPQSGIFDDLTLSRIQQSFIYFTGQTMQITEDYKVFGFDITLYMEGMESLGFKKFKMSAGFGQRKQGFSLNKIWYTRSQGVIGRVSFFYEREKRVNSLTSLGYEERSVLKDYVGPQRQADLMNSTTVQLNDRTSLGFTGNYNSSRLWNTNARLNTRWSRAVSTVFNFSYNKPVNYKGEAWLGVQSHIDAGKYGSISLLGKYELQNQLLGSFSYGASLFKNMSLLLSSSYSKVKISGSQDFSEIVSGIVSLSHNNRFFNLSSDYYLNYDLMGDQLLSQPRLNLGLKPISLYDGMLLINLNNIFLYNNLKKNDYNEYTYSNNTIFNLSTFPIHIQKSFYLSFQIAIEQFLEKEGRNFTSNGFIFNVSKECFRGFFLEGYYRAQSRRRTKNWLIEGTTSQDMSAIFRVNPDDRIHAWASFSYDPKNRQWRQSFVDLSFKFFRNWRFHSLLNYDFLLRKINNVDLYIIREAGRVQLRFVWRSLSKQFLVELIPR